MFLGDGSFEDCVQLGVFAEECEGNLDVLSSEDGFLAALRDVRVPTVVVDYVGSVIPVFDVRFSRSCSVSDAVVVNHLKRDYHADEVMARSLTYELSECFVSLGMRHYSYKLFEKTGAEGRINRGTAYRNHNIRMNYYRDFGLANFDDLDKLANSMEPVNFVVENFDVRYDAHSFSNVFFNKHLSADDVFRLWNLMSIEKGEDFLGFHHVYLLLAVLLREDWSVAELRLFFEWWMGFSAMLSDGLMRPGLQSEFEWLCESVRILFASNISTPVDLLLKLFENGSGSVGPMDGVRVAVVRNAAVGEDFVSDVVHGVGEVVVSGTSVVVSEVVRTAALLNPVWGFEALMKVVEDKNESAGARFSALFNESVPSFYRALYA